METIFCGDLEAFRFKRRQRGWKKTGIKENRRAVVFGFKKGREGRSQCFPKQVGPVRQK